MWYDIVPHVALNAILLKVANMVKIPSRRFSNSVVPDIRFNASGDDARSRIITAATALFRQKAFHAVSLDAIAGAAHMSKRTIYEHFANKHAILEVVLTDFTTASFRRIAARRTQMHSPREDLLAMAKELQKVATTSESLAMVRLQIAEAQHLPEVAERLTNHGLRETVSLLRGPLKHLGVTDLEGAAQVAYDLLVLAPLHRRLTGSSRSENDHAKVVALILAAYK